VVFVLLLKVAKLLVLLLLSPSNEPNPVAGLMIPLDWLGFTSGQSGSLGYGLVFIELEELSPAARGSVEGAEVPGPGFEVAWLIIKD
jgi:hypothetical protein